MAKRKGLVRVSTFIREDQLARMKEIQTDVGVPVAEQIRRAIDVALGIKSSSKGGR